MSVFENSFISLFTHWNIIPGDNNRLFPMDFQTINGPTNVTSGPPPTAAPAVAPNLTNHLPVVPAPNQGIVVTSAIDASVNVPLSTTQAFRGTEPSGVAPSVATPPPVQNHTNVYQQQQPPSHLIPGILPPLKDTFPHRCPIVMYVPFLLRWIIKQETWIWKGLHRMRKVLIARTRQ